MMGLLINWRAFQNMTQNLMPLVEKLSVISTNFGSISHSRENLFTFYETPGDSEAGLCQLSLFLDVDLRV